ncbi:GntR family transcriptional regulator [Eubacteriales bacterium OttesenSCG-928-K08]|nr:GntR family transcriptional regulator [Eubacteriales bacterium OttesenSCG-928-K08]
MDLKEQLENLRLNNPFLSKTDLVHTVVIDAILSGFLKCGQRISQEDLSAQLGLSRSPVREAMNRLALDGYLVREGASGYSVYTLKMEDYLAINEFRLMLEIYSSELAVKNILGDQLAKLKQNVAKTKNAVEKNDMVTFSLLDSEFHEIIISASQNPYLIETYRQFEKKFDLFRTATLISDMLPDAYRWHKMIYEAIASGDSQGAAMAAKIHRENTVSGALMMAKANRRP